MQKRTQTNTQTNSVA